MVKGAFAGIAAAASWAAAEPLGRRLLRPPPGYSDIRLLGGLLTPGPRWRPLGLGAHLVNGAVFGAVFERVGGAGWKQGLAAAQAENLALWPGMAVLDRVHPDRRSGAWPPLAPNGHVFAYEAAMHAVFGVVLGLLSRRRGSRSRPAGTGRERMIERTGKDELRPEELEAEIAAAIPDEDELSGLREDPDPEAPEDESR
jgi:hypothetical protein